MFGRGKSRVYPTARPDLEYQMLKQNRLATELARKERELKRQIDEKNNSIYNLSELIPSMLQNIMDSPKEIKMIMSKGEPYYEATDPVSLSVIAKAEAERAKKARRRSSLLSLQSSLPKFMRGATEGRIKMSDLGDN